MTKNDIDNYCILSKIYLLILSAQAQESELDNLPLGRAILHWGLYQTCSQLKHRQAQGTRKVMSLET